MGETSATKVRSDAEWDERGDAMNLDIQVEAGAADGRGAAPPPRGARRAPRLPHGGAGIRWLKHADNPAFFIEETIDHYTGHTADLEAILDAAEGRERDDAVTIPDPKSASTLEQQVAELAADLPDVTTAPGGAGRVWSRGEVEFAVVGPFGVEIRLDRQVAAAATRTPDTASSPRDPTGSASTPESSTLTRLGSTPGLAEFAHRRAGE